MSCGVSCNTNFHACGGACASNSAPATCGTSCTPCATPANGSATCNGTSCGIACNTGFHACGSTCVSDTAVATCGTRCTTCPAGPANSTPACTSGSCDFTCNQGYSRCGSSCCYAFTRIATGSDRTCGLTSFGGVKCWGRGWYGSTASLVPVDHPGLTTGVIDLAMEGYNLCALMTNGTVRCTGQNYFGEAGGPQGTARNTPTLVPNLSNVTAISMGDRLSCGLVSGHVKCWGNPSEYSMVGSAQPVNGIYSPPGFSGVTQLSVGYSAVCGLVAGEVRCIGPNSYGQLGTGNNMTSSTPVAALGITNATMVSTGAYNTCAIEGGALKCWGLFTTTSANTPVTLINSGVTWVSARGFACVATTSGAMCSGANHFGRLGDGTTTDQYSFVPVSGSPTVQQILLGGSSSCAITTDGRALCWGDNTYGQLGNGTTTSSLVPVEVLRQ